MVGIILATGCCCQCCCVVCGYLVSVFGDEEESENSGEHIPFTAWSVPLKTTAHSRRFSLTYCSGLLSKERKKYKLHSFTYDSGVNKSDSRKKWDF